MVTTTAIRTMAEIMGVSRPAVREALRALELLGIVKPVPGGGNYITEDLDTWLIEPLSILFKLNNGYLRQNQQFRAALEREAAILAARKCTPLDAAELWVILARLDAAEDEKIRGELDRERNNVGFINGKLTGVLCRDRVDDGHGDRISTYGFGGIQTDNMTIFEFHHHLFFGVVPVGNVVLW